MFYGTIEISRCDSWLYRFLIFAFFLNVYGALVLLNILKSLGKRENVRQASHKNC